jgi:hypothetical protein
VSARRPKYRQRYRAYARRSHRARIAARRRGWRGFMLRRLPDGYVIGTPNPSAEHREMGARQR